MAAVAAEILPAVLEHLTRIAANHATCSRPTSYPHPPGLESGLWIRRPGAVTLLQVLFVLVADESEIGVRRVLLTEMERLPDWVLRPDEWGAYPPWPVVDL